MFLLNTTMLREKFIIREDDGKAEPMVAVGNRIALPLTSRSGTTTETLIVRGQNMHTTLRMAAMIIRTFYNDGPILSRSPGYPWGPNWQEALPAFEKSGNTRNWVAVYSGGRPIFKDGAYHPFLDIIEQCDARNRDEYDRAAKIAETAFNQAGRNVTIEHNTNIAMVFSAMEDKSRAGLIYRSPQHSSTFNFNVDTPETLTKIIKKKAETASKATPKPTPKAALKKPSLSLAERTERFLNTPIVLPDLVEKTSKMLNTPITMPKGFDKVLHAPIYVAKDFHVEPHLCLLHAAAWLELVQLSVTAGFYKARRADLVAGQQPLEKVESRLNKLSTEINSFENMYGVMYRPERPKMTDLIEEAIRYARGNR